MKAFLLFLYNEMPADVVLNIRVCKVSEHPSLARTVTLRFTKMQGFFPSKFKSVTITVELLKDGMNIDSYVKETIRKILKEL